MLSIESVYRRSPTRMLVSIDSRSAPRTLAGACSIWFQIALFHSAAAQPCIHRPALARDPNSNSGLTDPAPLGELVPLRFGIELRCETAHEIVDTGSM